MPTTSEHAIAIAVMKVAAQKPNGVATFDHLYNEIPHHIQLTTDDLKGSQTRDGEPMWHQIVRNIQSHHEVDENAIREGWLDHVPRVGYRITEKGRKYIA